MSLHLNEDQLRWISEKVENPLKRLLKIYFLQFDKDTLQDWCRNNHVTGLDVPSSYKEYAEYVRSTKRVDPENPNPRDELMTYPKKPGIITYKHRAAGWFIYLDIVPYTVEWDDEMVADHIKPSMGQIIKGVDIYLSILKQRFPDLFSTLSISMDDKNLTLVLRDAKFPDAKFPSRLGFIIEKTYM